MGAVAIVGSSHYPDLQAVEAFVALLPRGTRVFSGAGGDVDLTAAAAARKRCLPLKELPADWKNLGGFAGPLRNSQLVDALPEGAKVVAFWDGRSPGTKDTILKAHRAGFDVHIKRPGEPWSHMPAKIRVPVTRPSYDYSAPCGLAGCRLPGRHHH